VRLVWVKGHAGNPLNEYVDRLAVGAYQHGKLEVDEGYEAGI
jgi:ribonuclease HI